MWSFLGLVAITAGPDIVDHYWAVIIGAIGAVLCTAGIRFLEKVKLDDVVGAIGIPAHLITAGPDIVDHYWAVIIGAIGAVLCTAGIRFAGIGVLWRSA